MTINWQETVDDFYRRNPDTPFVAFSGERFPPQPLTQIIHLYKYYKSMNVLALKLRIYPKTLSRFMHQNGVVIQSRSQAATQDTPKKIRALAAIARLHPTKKPVVIAKAAKVSENLIRYYLRKLKEGA
jgi:hypothetical protein